MRVVLDTNVFIASIGRSSQLRPIFDALRTGKITLLISTEIFMEYIEKLEVHTSAEIALNIGRALEESVNVDAISVYYFWNVIPADEDDNKFFDCAVAGNANYLVTNDHHFNGVRNLVFPSLAIVTSTEFLNILNSV